jgi:hypothetical protein
MPRFLSWSFLIIFCIYFPFWLIILTVNSCNVHVLYKIIFSNKHDLFWTRTLFLCWRNGYSRQFAAEQKSLDLFYSIFHASYHFITQLFQPLYEVSLIMDKLKLTGQNLGPVFNFRCMCHTIALLHKRPSLKLKTRPNQLLSSVP